MSTTDLSVIIDDTDPRIVYSPGWRLQTGFDLQAMGPSVFPLYGTLHVNEFDFSSGSANFTFIFTGVGITAFFTNTNISTIDSCTLDGQPMAISLDNDSHTVNCTAKQLSQQGHEFVVSLVAGWKESVSFDYIEYSPGKTNTLATDLDLGYYVPHMTLTDANSTINTSTGVPQLTSLGDSLDFTFVGYSLSVYCAYWSIDSHIPSPISYFIDEDAPISFDVSNPITFDVAAPQVISKMILIQTPRYPLGQHHFHLDFLGNDYSVPLHLQSIIVQNITTPHVLLDSIPSTGAVVLDPIQSIGTVARGRGIIWGAIVGAIVVVLLLPLTFFIYRRRRQSFNIKVEPFQQRHSTWQSGFRKNLIHEGLSDSSIMELGNSGVGPASIHNQLPFPYRVHEDSGNQIAQPGRDIIDLPPVYATIEPTMLLAAILRNHQPVSRGENEESDAG